MTTNRYRLLMTVSLFAICIIAALIAGSFLLPQEDGEAAAPAAELAYYIKASGNRILVYRTGESDAIYTLETPLNVLPQADQSDLNEGMYIPDEEALRQIIEDFEG